MPVPTAIPPTQLRWFALLTSFAALPTQGRETDRPFSDWTGIALFMVTQTLRFPPFHSGTVNGFFDNFVSVKSRTSGRRM